MTDPVLRAIAIVIVFIMLLIMTLALGHLAWGWA